MIIDSHCHAFELWPENSVPDPESRGSFAQLKFELDAAGVDKALIICGGRDPGNKDYVFENIGDAKSRFYLVPDLDCRWSDTYHQPGSTDRLKSLIETYSPRGFTHYMRDDDDGEWLTSKEAEQLFERSAEAKLIVSIHVLPHQLGHLRSAARNCLELPFLIHHLGFPRGAEAKIREIELCAEVPNLHVKVSGFDIGYARPWDYPYADALSTVKRIISAYGTSRAHWGSNYPMCKSSMTYRQSLEGLREHVSLASDQAMNNVLGDSLRLLLDR